MNPDYYVSSSDDFIEQLLTGLAAKIGTEMYRRTTDGYLYWGEGFYDNKVFVKIENGYLHLHMQHTSDKRTLELANPKLIDELKMTWISMRFGSYATLR